MSAETLQLPDPPPASSVHATVDEGQLTLAAPSNGLVRGSFGLALMGPFVILVPIVIIVRGGSSLSAFHPGVLAWLGVILLVGIVFTLIGIDLGTANATVTVDHEGVTLHRKSRLRSTRKFIPHNAVKEVTLGEGPVTVSNKPIFRLEVHPTSDERPTIKTFTARPQIHLEWARRCVNAALKHHGG